MFHFPAFPPHPMYSAAGNTTSLVLGFPIRTSSDPRSVDSSPRHIAASHVLHRLPMPRHPPCALKHLQHKNQNYINLKNCTSTNTTPATPQHEGRHACVLDARNHYPQIKHHTPPPKRSNNKPTPTGADPHRGSHHLRFPTSGRRGDGPVVSKPNSVSDDLLTGAFPHRLNVCCLHPNPTPTTGAAHPSIARNRTDPHRCGPARVSWCSLERR